MTPLVIPKLSMSGEPVRLVEWLVEDGTSVVSGQPVAELETEKATVEIQAPATGLLRIVVAAGMDADVDTVIAHIDNGSELRIEATPEESANRVHRPSSAAPDSVPEQRRHREPSHIVASPAAKRLASELRIDLDSIVGSGPGGRIVVGDLEQVALKKESLQPQRRREAVVADLTASWTQIPHIHIGGRLDGEGIAGARRMFQRQVTVTDLIAYSLVRALEDTPSLNGTFADGSSRLSSAVHLGLAIATASGVTAPTIRNADALDLEQLSQERARLVAAARAETLDKSDLGGATITLSNLGAYPVDFFAPIIVGPQLCVVATGRLTEVAIAVDGAIAVKHRIWVNVAIDHRVADGETGGILLGALERQFANLLVLHPREGVGL